MWNVQKAMCFQSLAFIAIASFCAAARAQGRNEGGKNNTAEFGAAAEGYRSNRESFEFFRCRYTVTTAKARTIQDAIDGIFIDPIKAEHRWIVNRKNVKYEVTGDEVILRDALRKPGVGNAVEVPFDPTCRLTDGVIQLAYSPVLNGANVWPPGVEGSGADITPFGLGIMGTNEKVNPGRVLRDCADGKVFGSYEGSRLVNGADLLVFSRGDGNYYRLQFLIDPHKGFNPIQITGKSPDDKQLGYRAYFTYKECSRQRWFPVRGLVIDWPERADPPFTIREVKVVELDAETPPALDEFYVDLPDKTLVSDPTRNAAYYYVKGGEHVTPADLKSIFNRCKVRLPLGPDPAVPATPVNTVLRVAWWLSSGAFLLLAASFLIFRWFRRRRQAPPTA